VIGQLDKRKNFHVVVSAIRELLNNGEDARLWDFAGYSIVTDDDLKSVLDACTPEQRSRISIEGIVSDAELLAIYDAVDVVRFPHSRKALGCLSSKRCRAENVSSPQSQLPLHGTCDEV